MIDTNRFTNYLYELSSRYKCYLTDLENRYYQERETCCVCNYLVVKNRNCVECQGCHCLVHPSCYNLAKIPSEPWYCIVCEDILRFRLHRSDYKEHSVSKGKSFQFQLLALRKEVHCCICGFSEGALIRTVLDGIYCHVCCALCCEEVSITNMGGNQDQSLFQEYYASPSRHIPICNPLRLFRKRQLNCCTFCQRYGGTVKCTNPQCNLWCHVPCGFLNSWKMNYSSDKVAKSVDAPPSLSTLQGVLCHGHLLYTSRETNSLLHIATNQCDVLTATWDDFTCLSWSVPPFCVPSLFNSKPLLYILEKMGSCSSKQNSKKMQQCTAYYQCLLQFINNTVWRISDSESDDSANVIVDPSVTIPDHQGIKRAKEDQEVTSELPSKMKQAKVATVSENVILTQPVHSKTSTTKKTLGKQTSYGNQRRHIGTSPQIPIPDLSDIYKKPKSVQTYRSILLRFLSSPSFCSVFGEYPYNTPTSDDQSFQRYIYHYHRGVNRSVFEHCTQGKFDLEELLEASNEEMISLQELLQSLHRPHLSVVKLISIIRCLLISSLYSVFPTHLTVTLMSQKKSTCVRNLVVETMHLSQVCHQLFDIALEFNNLSVFFCDPNKYRRSRKSSSYFPQCVCLSDQSSSSNWIVCDMCHVGYHPECLGLKVTSYQDLIQTKFYGYWNLSRGFLCPRCCDGDVYELSRFHKGSVQIKDKLVLKWINTLKREEKKKKS